MPKQYTYKPLSKPTSIRLVYGCGYSSSASRNASDPIQGQSHTATQHYSLREVDLDSNPEFDALSYTWQVNPKKPTSEPSEKVICDDQILAIGRNLDNAFKRLAKVERDRPIWIDAICINQEDVAERTSQVQMMERIYSSAHTVVVWLGPSLQGVPAQDMRAIMDRLPRIDAASFGTDLDFTGFAQSMASIGFRLSEWLNIMELFTYPWFSRVWTIQEIMLAKRMVVLCGETEFPWTGLYNAALTVSTFHRTTAGSSALQAANRRDVDGARLHVLMKQHQTQVKRPLNVYLDLTRSHDATDPRDKVFSLLGLMQPEGALGAPTADYSLPVETVYLDCAKYILHGSAGLGLLSMVEDRSERRLHALPSWVPDLTAIPEAARLAGSAPPRREAPSYQLKDKSLLVHASPCGTVDAVAESFADIYERLRALELLRIISSLDARSPTTPGVSALQAVRDTIAAPVAGLDNPAPARLRASFADWIAVLFMACTAWAETGLDPTSPSTAFLKGAAAVNKLKDWDAGVRDAAGPLRDAARRFQQAFADEIDLEAKTKAFRSALEKRAGTPEHADFARQLRGPANLYESAFSRSYRGRRLFRTKEGFVGLGPESTKPGDLVFVLRGAHVPFLLRSVSGGTHELVGETYVHGFMEGQPMHGAKREFGRIEIV